MELSDRDKEILKAATQLVWAKGTHNPQEAAIAQALTDLTNRAIAPQKPAEPEKK